MHQLSLFFIIVVISGAICEDAVILMAECPRTKLLNMDPRGKVYLSPEGPPSPNITLGGRIVATVDGSFKALTTLYFKSRQKYLCFDSNSQLRGETNLSDRCYFLENDVRGKYEYRLWQQEELAVQFRRKGGNPPCSEFHKINSNKYHSVPSTIRASSRINPSAEKNSSKSHSKNSTLSTMKSNRRINNDRRPHRHHHGNNKKHVERRRWQQRNKDQNMHIRNSSAVAAALQHHNSGDKHMIRDRRKMTTALQQNNQRGKKHRLHRSQWIDSGAISMLCSPESIDNAQKSSESRTLADCARSKNSSQVTSLPHKSGSRRPSNLDENHEYSNDEPIAFNAREIQNSLIDSLNPISKPYLQSRLAHSRSSVISLDGNYVGESQRHRKGKVNDSNDNILDTNSSSNTKYISPKSSISSSQATPRRTKKYYRNKTYKPAGADKPGKVRSFRNSHLWKYKNID